MLQLNTCQEREIYNTLKITLFQIREQKESVDNRGVGGILLLYNLNYEILNIYGRIHVDYSTL